MQRRSTAVVIMAIVLILVVALAAFAQAPQTQQNGRKGGHGGQGGGMQGAPGAFANLQRILMPPGLRDFEKMGTAMGLTDDQKAKIKDLYKTFMTALKQVGPDRGANVKAVLQGVQANASKGDLQAMATKVGQADQAILSAEFDFWAGLKGILNTQQQAQAQSFVTQRAEREMAGGRPGGPTAPKPNGAAPQGGPSPSKW